MRYQMRFRLLLLVGMLIGVGLFAFLWSQRFGAPFAGFGGADTRVETEAENTAHAASGLGLAQAQGAQNDQGESSSALQARQVQTITAKLGALTATRVTSVIVEPAQESRIAAGTSGRVLNVLQREDARVTEGEPIILLDTQTLELEEQNTVFEVESARVALQREQQANQEEQSRATSALRSAEVTLNAARQRYTEAQQLYAEGFISQAELANLEAQFVQAETTYSEAQSAVARSNRATTEGLEILRLSLEQAQNRLTRIRQALDAATIRAPFTGEIVELLIEEGETVQSGEPVFRLANSAEQVARFNVPLDVAARLLEQGILYIKYGGLDYGAKVLSQSRVDPETQLVEITARLYQSQAQIPNGVVTQLPYAYQAAEGIILPADAVQNEAGQTFVYAVEGRTAIRQEVDVLAEVEGRVAISGLSEGTQVIHPVPAGLREGSELALSEGS